MKKVLLCLLAAVSLFFSGCQNIENPSVTDSSSAAQITSAATEKTAVTTQPAVRTTDVTTAEPPAPQPKTVSFCAVGDNLIHSPIYYQARTNDGYDFSKAYKDVEDIIKAADLAVINQETLICNDMYEPSNYPLFNTPTALGDHMIDIGFDVFTLANNHCLDYGEQGLSYAFDYWAGKNVITAGVYQNQQDKDNIRTGEFGGVTFSFLSYTQSLNGLRLPDNSEKIIGDANDLEGMTADIKKAKEISDVCVVALHWGVEGSGITEDWQREYASRLAEAGADIIIGNHPHVLRDIEMIKTSRGETLCAYSLGNFISAQNVGANLVSGILEFNVTVADKSDKKEVSVTDVKLTPIVTHYDSGYTNLRLYKLSNYTPELALAHGVRSYSYFSYDYILEVLKNAVDEKYLAL